MMHPGPRKVYWTVNCCLVTSALNIYNGEYKDRAPWWQMSEGIFLTWSITVTATWKRAYQTLPGTWVLSCLKSSSCLPFPVELKGVSAPPRSRHLQAALLQRGTKSEMYHNSFDDTWKQSIPIKNVDVFLNENFAGNLNWPNLGKRGWCLRTHLIH